MNKISFTDELKMKYDLDDDMCKKINNILDESLISGTLIKKKLVSRFINELDMSSETANELYSSVFKIFESKIKNKIKHPLQIIEKKKKA